MTINKAVVDEHDLLRLPSCTPLCQHTNRQTDGVGYNRISLTLFGLGTLKSVMQVFRKIKADKTKIIVSYFISSM